MRKCVAKLGYEFLPTIRRRCLHGARVSVFLRFTENCLDSIEPEIIEHFGVMVVKEPRYGLRRDALRFEFCCRFCALRASFDAA